MSSPPNRSCAVLTSRSETLSSQISPAKVATSDLSDAASACSGSTSRSERTSFAPSAASRLASWEPNPPVAPLSNTVIPSNDLMAVGLDERCSCCLASHSGTASSHLAGVHLPASFVDHAIKVKFIHAYKPAIAMSGTLGTYDEA